jgi:hypothetical protein
MYVCMYVRTYVRMCVCVRAGGTCVRAWYLTEKEWQQRDEEVVQILLSRWCQNSCQDDLPSTRRS